MTKHRTQEDGKLREPDNWKKGMGKQVWMDSMARHFWDVWEVHQHGGSVRPENGERVELEEALDGLLFNVMGYLFETLNDMQNLRKTTNKKRAGNNKLGKHRSN